MIAWAGKRRFAALAAVAIVVLAQAACGASSPKGAFDHPAIGDRLIYISSVDGHLYALDKEGDLAWREAVGNQRDPEPLIAGPVLARDSVPPVVLVGSDDGNLYAYDASEGGDPLWSFPTGDKVWSTPVVRDGIVYFGSHDKNVYALHVGDGTEKWRYRTGGAVAGRPLLFRELLVVGSFDRKLYGIDADSGTLRWTLKGGNWFWAGAVANESTIFAPNMDGNIYAVDGEGNLLWKYDLGSAIVSRPALVSGALAVAAKNGRNIWLLDTNPGIIGADRLIDSEFVSDKEIKAPIFVDGNTLYVGTQGSTVIRLDIGTNRAGRLDLDEKWCFDTKEDRECES